MTRAIWPTILLLGGCGAATDEGPSLLPRAIERQSLDAPAVVAAAPPTPDPALDARIAAVRLAIRDDERAFDLADRAAAPALTAGARARVGSDAWLDAQTAVAGLDAARATLSAIVSELDDLATARGLAGLAPYPALDAAQRDADAALGRVTARLATRKAALAID